jgi:hypothetical protein
MNLTSRTRGLLAASLVFIGMVASVGHAQTVTVNGTTCAAATVTLGAGVININTAGCGGTVITPPSISSLSVPNGLRNAALTINGANLANAAVTIGGAAASITSNSGSAIITSVPAAAAIGAGSVVVNVAGQTASAAFTVDAPVLTQPVISSVSPANGVAGTVVTINGSGLQGGTLTIGGATASFTIVNATSISAPVPAGATIGAANGIVFAVTGFANATAAFTVDAPPPPTISLVSPAAGVAGSTVNISGTGLTGATVTIGGATASVTTSSATSITASVPAAAPVGLGNVVVTTLGGTATATGAFTVQVGSPVEKSIEGFTLTNPSKQAFVLGPGHAGANGGGNEVNAWAMDPTRCSTTPALSRSWQHNIDLADYKGKNAFDFFILQANEALSYKFTVGQVDVSGGFIYNDAANATVRPTFISITTAPCDFDTSKLVVGPTRNSCYQTGLNGNSVNWANITGPLPDAYCRLVKGQTYYMNIRFQDARPASQGGSPTTDSCTGGNCGGIIQAL